MITSQTSSQVPILGPYRGKGWKIKKKFKIFRPLKEGMTSLGHGLELLCEHVIN